MKAGKNAFIFLFLLQLLLPSFAKAGFVAKERNITYDLQFDLKWYQKVLAVILQYEFLSWKEFIFQELFINTATDLNPELIVVSITPKNFNEAVFLRNAGSKTGGFIRFVNYKEFDLEGVKKILEIVNYLYLSEEKEKEFQNINLSAKDDKNPQWMTWKVTKKKQNNKMLIKIVVFDPKSEKGGKIVEEARLEIILNPLEKVFEKVTAEIKNGPKFIITKKP